MMKHVLLWSLLFSAGLCKNRDAFIVDGIVAKKLTFPHSAFLSVSCLTTQHKVWKYWTCGASVVNQRVLLTAAHCLYLCHRVEILIKVGDVNKETAIVVKYSHHRLHENYQDFGTLNDIAVIVTKENMPLGIGVRRVALMKNPPKEGATIAGWGRIYDAFDFQDDNLRVAQQKIITNKKCLDLIHKKPKGTICGMAEKGYPSLGDSGSALVVRNYIQVGIVSFRPPTHYSLTVYTNVAFFLKWIKETVRDIYCIAGRS